MMLQILVETKDVIIGVVTVCSSACGPCSQSLLHALTYAFSYPKLSCGESLIPGRRRLWMALLLSDNNVLGYPQPQC